jgi:hypothetical protein
MNALLLPRLFAALPTAPERAPQAPVPGINRDAMAVLITCSALGVLLLLLVLWWWQGRRKHRRHHHRHRHHHAASSLENAETGAGTITDAAEAGETAVTPHHRRRRRRRAHRSRNPTLAETGGLPPPRPEGETPPGL